ncbi:MAG TPA: S8 family peptidase, partial [Bryobacteraceae bacterium]|nr:S8 family peptidase [Bryobacteraceae bacterium]
MRHDTYTPGGTARAPLANMLPRIPASVLSRAGTTLMRLTQLTVLLALPGVVFAGSKIAPDLQANSSSTVDVIVQFVNPPTKQQLKQLGAYGRMKHIFDGIKAAHLSLPMSVVQALSNDPSILYISPDRNMAGSLDLADPTTNATLAWQQYGVDGTGVGVAIIDSGVSLKNDLKTKDTLGSRIVYSESFVSGGDPSDAYGHGTHVAGIVAANGADSTGPNFARTFKGIAPNANIINLRVLDQNGAGTESGVIAAIQRAIQLQSTYNIRVLNLSLGHPIYESYTLDPLCQAVEQAWKAGIVVVTAAGNYGRDNSNGRHGYGTIASPGDDPYVITVGASSMNGTPYRTDDTITSFSSKGPTLIDHIVKPDLVAPGNNIVSLLASPTCTLLAQYPKTQVNSSTYCTNCETLGTYSTASASYFRLSGTSMATPMVSGAVALLLQYQPSLAPDQVKARLMKTAAKILPQYSTGTDILTLAKFNNQSDIFSVGAGYLDIAAALASND